MQQENKVKIAEGLALLADLKEKRGGNVLNFHRKCANDTTLLQAFISQYNFCNGKENTVLERKYRELLLLALGCSKGNQTTIKTHAQLALKNGATLEEIGEVLRLVFFYCGASALIPAVELFDLLEGSDRL